MPRVRPRRRFKPDETVVAWTSFAFADTVIGEGARLRGDHEAVQAAPSNFVRDGTLPAEMPDIYGEPDPEQDNPEQLDVQLMADLAEYQEPHLVTLTRDIKVGVGLDQGRPARVVELKKGTVFPADSEIVQLRPSLFENGKRP